MKMKKLSARKKKWIERTVANNRSYKLYLYNRFLTFLLLVLAQIGGLIFLAYLFVYNSRMAIVTQATVGVLQILVLLYLLNKNERPSTKLNWILLILILPIVGVPSYLLYGEGRPTRKMNQKIALAKEENARGMEEVCGVAELEEVNNRSESIGRYLNLYGGYPAYFDGTVEYFKSGEELFPVMLAELEKAEKFILLDYFIISHGKMWNSILERLLKKAEEGVQIRIIYDDFGCMMTLPPDYDRYLESLHKNIRCMTFNNVVPIFTVRMNNRDHRKIFVVDGRVAITGGINLADEYIGEKKRFGYWKDTGVRITGPSVQSFIQMFFYVWNAFRSDKEDIRGYISSVKDGGRCATKDTKLRIQPYDDSPLDGISAGETVYLDIIHRATKYVYIFTPYLVLDDSMRGALCMAAARGVDVRIVTPGIPDKKMVFRLTRANYGMLMKAGVKIYEYTPGFIHAKSMVSDDECAVVGTINLDYRSLYLHFENAVYFSGCDAVLDVKRDAEETFAVSRLCTAEDIKRGVIGRVIDSLLRVFETLL